MNKRVEKKKKTISFRGAFKIDVVPGTKTLVVDYKNGNKVFIEGFK